MHKPISRRTMLRGAGATMALPWLETMQAAPAKGPERLTEPPLRVAFLFMPNGVRPDYWTPAGDGPDYAFTPHLKALEPLKNEFLLLENLWNAKTVGRNGHWPKVPAFLSGGYVQRSTGKDLDIGGTSADQLVARHIGSRTPLPSLELGTEPPRTGIDNIGGGFARIYGSYISWRDPHTPVPKEIVPQLAFDRLFRGGAAPVLGGSGVSSYQGDDKSVLDAVLESARSLRAQASANDKIKLDEYFESVRSVENRIEAAMKPQKRWINEAKYPMERPAAGIPESHQEYVRLMFDILLLAFWTDTTRIATYMLGDAQSGRDFSFLDGVHGSFHSLSHHRDEPPKREQYEKIVTWHVEQVAWFLEKMRKLDEGGSSLLDNSMVMFGSTLKCGNRHDPENLPLILAGRAKGAIRTGRRLRAPEKTPLCNLYMAMLQRFGIEEQSFGDSTGTLDLA
ncbi:MAG: DUF1552 domain-containing protein [Bryobacteraceae bacterium]